MGDDVIRPLGEVTKSPRYLGTYQGKYLSVNKGSTLV